MNFQPSPSEWRHTWAMYWPRGSVSPVVTVAATWNDSFMAAPVDV